MGRSLIIAAALSCAGAVCAKENFPMSSKARPAAASLDTLVGKPADIASSAYQYRADRPADRNDPESWILVLRHAGAAMDRPGPADIRSPAVKQVICALLWEEVRQIRKVDVVWSDDRHPAADELALMYADSDQWWRTGTKKAARAEASPDGRKHSFTVPQDTFGLLLCAFDAQGRPKDAGGYSVPAVRVYGRDTWKKMDLEIEWGFEPSRAPLAYDGSVEAYDGVVGDVKPLAGDDGTVVNGAGAWRSAKGSGARRGARLSLLYMGTSPWRRMWPNVPSPTDLPRTIVTVRTRSGSFSFLAADLENGPILAPEYGFFVRATSAMDTGPKDAPAAPKAQRVSKELLAAKVNNLLGNADLNGWGTAQTPFVVTNAAKSPITVLTNLTFPPGCVAVHPGAGSDVAVGWRSPITGRIAIHAKVAGLQPGGDGIAWSLVRGSAKGHAVLSKGAIDSGGRQSLIDRPEAKELADLAIGAGDDLLLLVNRRGSHTCDSTGVEFVIKEEGGKERTWDLAKDVLGSIHAGNPHADSLGNAGVWSFYAIPETEPSVPTTPAKHEPPLEMQSKAASAAEFIKELEAKGLKTVRQRVRQSPEQSWDGATKARFGGRDLPPIPPTELAPAMQVEVPCERLTAQWNLGAWHILRRAQRSSNGEVRLADFPYSVLAQETFLMVYALDLAGMHKEAAQALDLWFDMPLVVTKPAGFFSDGNGVFSSATTGGRGGGMDTAHAMGPGTIGWVMAEHYRLTGDKEWLKAKAPRMQANAEWILRQRRLLADIIPGGQRLWSKGLQPAHQLTPDAGGLFAQFYTSEGYYWLAVKSLADILADIDPAGAAKLSAEADAYRQDILAAVNRSIMLSPLVPVRDGTYRSFIPPVCHARGPISLAWMWRRRHSLNHWDGIAWDISMGGMGLLSPSGLLPLSDPRAQGHMDVLEDRFLLEHRKLWMRKADYDPQRDWFNAGWHHQCAYERNSQIHLACDDAPNFLRSTLNQYAVHVVPGAYTFSEHSTRGPADKPFEEAGFMERFRGMLVYEEGASLWLARATPRAWLKQGGKIAVKNAPTCFGTVAYEIVSDVDNGRMAATVKLPARKAPEAVLLRLRHPTGAGIEAVTVNGAKSEAFDAAKEVVRLEGLTGTAEVEVSYKR